MFLTISHTTAMHSQMKSFGVFESDNYSVTNLGSIEQALGAAAGQGCQSLLRDFGFVFTLCSSQQ